MSPTARISLATRFGRTVPVPIEMPPEPFASIEARLVLTRERFLSLVRIWVEPCFFWRDFLNCFWCPRSASSDSFTPAATEVPFGEALTIEAGAPEAPHLGCVRLCED